MVDLVENGWIDPAPDFVVEDIQGKYGTSSRAECQYDGKVYGYIQHIGIRLPLSMPGCIVRLVWTHHNL